ncbi:MAG: hypothetical protein EA404_14080 [Spirochaetaceae bacterium]|nr:MAG: hypothetical protein EA404_14080 [Spirochaetaceae bacterium]
MLAGQSNYSSWTSGLQEIYDFPVFIRIVEGKTFGHIYTTQVDFSPVSFANRYAGIPSGMNVW